MSYSLEIEGLVSYKHKLEAEIELLRSLNAELAAALEWALPLAEMKLEDHRYVRLQYGGDIETDHVGLSNTKSSRAARAALAKVKEEK